MRSEPRKVITFYSYKGGTGRSLALANVAWILASQGKRVLAIDWDLEAPGLHRYFAPFLIDPELFASEGLIDFVWEVATAAMTPADHSGEAVSSNVAGMDRVGFRELADYTIRLQWPFPAGGCLDLIPAGRQDAHYAERVNTFDWDNFYTRLGGGGVLSEARDQLREEYDYILIDSRTGVSDTAGICTVHMPDALAVFFTLNKQSIRGVEAAAASVVAQLPGIPIFPVPTRVDPFEKDKLVANLKHAKSVFGSLLGHVDPAARDEYWGDVEFPYVPYYAFEEVLAAFADERGRRTTMLAAATRLAGRLAGETFGELHPIEEATRLEILKRYSLEADTSQPLLPRAAPALAEVPAALQVAAASAMAAPPVHAPPPRRRVRPRAALLAGGAAVLLALGYLAAPRMLVNADPCAPAATPEEQLALLRDTMATPACKTDLLLRLYASDRSTDFAGASLARVDLSGDTLIGIRLSNANLSHANLSHAVLDSANLSGADLRHAKLDSARLTRANLTDAVLDSADLSGADLRDAKVPEEALYASITTPLTIGPKGGHGPFRRDEDINVQTAAPVTDTAEAKNRGFIYIGNYDRRAGRWDRRLLGDRTSGRAVASDPGTFRPGMSFRVLGDVTLREAWPATTKSYFWDVVALGAVPHGSVVTLLGEPRPYLRPTGVTQYWAEVSVQSIRPPGRPTKGH